MDNKYAEMNLTPEIMTHSNNFNSPALKREKQTKKNQLHES